MSGTSRGPWACRTYGTILYPLMDRETRNKVPIYGPLLKIFFLRIRATDQLSKCFLTDTKCPQIEVPRLPINRSIQAGCRLVNLRPSSRYCLLKIRTIIRPTESPQSTRRNRRFNGFFMPNSLLPNIWTRRRFNCSLSLISLTEQRFKLDLRWALRGFKCLATISGQKGSRTETQLTRKMFPNFWSISGQKGSRTETQLTGKMLLKFWSISVVSDLLDNGAPRSGWAR